MQLFPTPDTMNKASVLITNTIASIDAELRDINLKVGCHGECLPWLPI